MKLGQWHFRVKPVYDHPRFEFLAWCARTPNLGSGPLEIPSEFDVHFSFGASATEALIKLKREVLQ